MGKQRKMTKGERAVWAAAYTKKFDISNPPGHVIMDSADWGAWELDRVATAVEHGWAAVAYLRDVEGRVIEGFGEDSDVFQMFKEMLR